MSSRTKLYAGILSALTTVSCFAHDFGLEVQNELQSPANLLDLFGLGGHVVTPAPETEGPFRTLTQNAAAQVKLAKGLTATYVTRNAGQDTDMIAFWPNSTNPTHLITCVEGGLETIGTYLSGKPILNPGVQRIRLSDGKVETILRGTSACDGIRRTPWGTILATEEEDDGGAYEILNPLTTTELTLVTRNTNVFQDSNGNAVAGKIAYRTALPTMAWEGLTILKNGIIYAGDELRPGTGNPDADGGAIFKFVPTKLSNGRKITNLNQSPLVAGKNYALQVSCVNSIQQFGQGCEIGNAAWIAVNADTVRADADKNGATGYYRPEDLHQDPIYKDPLNAKAIRFCWTNTGNEGASNFAEVVCAVDSDPVVADATKRTVIANRFIEGDTRFNAFDNLEFQPKSGNVYIIEDHDNGEVIACLRDGADRDIKSDGCVSILSVKDSSAEPTGFIFTADGTTAYVAIQHSDDTNMPKADFYPTDDVIKITGFKLPQ